MTRTVLGKQARRAQLVDAAIKVFAAKGYRAASITDIIDAAGVARGTFYLYFKSKLEAFHAVMDRYVDLYGEVAARQMKRSFKNPLSVRSAVRDSILELLKFFNENKDLAKVAFRDAYAIDPDYEKRYMEMLDSCYRQWREVIVHFQKAGFVRRDLDPDFLNIAVSGVMANVVLRLIIPNPRPNLEKIVDQWMEFSESLVNSKVSWIRTLVAR